MIEQDNQLDADTADRPGIDGSRGDVASALIQRVNDSVKYSSVGALPRSICN